MNVSFDKKKEEAIRRLKKIGLYELAIEDFEKNGNVNISEPPIGGLYWLDDSQKSIVDEFEKKHNALVYAGIRSVTNFGVLDSYLFISDYPEEWEDDDADLDDNCCLAYVYNNDAPDCSEMGSITFKRLPSGGLKRMF